MPWLGQLCDTIRYDTKKIRYDTMAHDTIPYDAIMLVVARQRSTCYDTTVFYGEKTRYPSTKQNRPA